jgi:hypothetical protein
MSLDSEIEVGANSFRLAFLMEDYGSRCSRPRRFSGTKKDNSMNTPFSYKSKRPPSKTNY